jgi:hypothetical protein
MAALLPSSQAYDRDEGTVMAVYVFPVPLTGASPERGTLIEGKSPSGKTRLRFDLDPDLNLHFVRDEGDVTRTARVNIGSLEGTQRLRVFGVWSKDAVRVHAGDADSEAPPLIGQGS